MYEGGQRENRAQSKKKSVRIRNGSKIKIKAKPSLTIPDAGPGGTQDIDNPNQINSDQKDRDEEMMSMIYSI